MRDRDIGKIIMINDYIFFKSQMNILASARYTKHPVSLKAIVVSQLVSKLVISLKFKPGCPN